MMDSTVVFLDIDGALCPYDTDWRRGGLPALSTYYDYKRITYLQVPIADHVEDFVRSLTPEKAVWSSSWGDGSIAPGLIRYTSAWLVVVIIGTIVVVFPGAGFTRPDIKRLGAGM